MKVGSRSSERWFNRALWLVALAFAWFLTALGSLIVGDLPQVEQHYTLEQFLDRDRAGPTAEALREVRRDRQENQRRVDRPSSNSRRRAPPRRRRARPSRTG